ncbi:hypothetical protein ACHAPT_005533 [Fusarium lateritium]
MCPYSHRVPHLLDVKGGDLPPVPLSRGPVLVWAAERGHVRTVKNILAVQKSWSLWINKPVLRSGHGTTYGSFGTTPIHAAASGGHVDVIDLLVEAGADAEATVAGNLRPIHFAKNEQAVMALVRHGSSIHPVEDPSLIQGAAEPPLVHVLKRKCDISAVRCLVRLGCDINATTWLGVTAADVAIQNGNVEALQVLLDAGADLSASRSDLSIPTSRIDYLISKVVYHHQEFRPYLALQLIRVLVRYQTSGEPNTGESSRRQPAEASSSHDAEDARDGCGPFGSISQKSIKPITRLLLDPKEALAGFEVRDRYLSMAFKLLDYGERLDSYRGNSMLVKLFSSYEHDFPEFLDRLFMFLLNQLAGNFIAHSRESPIKQPLVHFLFTRGYSLFNTDANTDNDFCLLERLLDFGMDPNERDNEGNTLLALLCQLPFHAFENQRRRNCNAAELLLKRGADINSLWQAENCILYEVVAQVSKWERDEKVYSWYFKSVSSQDCNLEVRDSNNTTPLGRVAAAAAPSPGWHKKKQNFMWHRADFLEFLLKMGADVHARQGPSEEKPLCAGGTPLHFACYDCDLIMLRLLLDYGAGEDVNQFSDKGLTPLMLLETALCDGMVRTEEFEEMEQLLFDAGADKRVKHTG